MILWITWQQFLHIAIEHPLLRFVWLGQPSLEHGSLPSGGV